MDQSAMNGGDGTNSYSKNSKFQRMAAGGVKERIDEEIYENLDVKNLSLNSNIIRLADLGCSTGPNTFIAMQNILDAIKQKHVSQNPNPQSLEFQVFFNDRTSNDFNTLFASLPPERQYFAAGVPGSFTDRLFPESSLHLVYTSYSLHWLSKVPEEVLDEKSPAWNKGRIFYLNAPREVYGAYRSRFRNDIDDFLNARAKEIVQGGMMVILMMGQPNKVDSQSYASGAALTYDFVASTFMEMAKEGLIGEALVDSFNMPVYVASQDEMFGLVEKNGCFIPQKIEYLKSIANDSSDIKSNLVKHIKAVLEGILSEHFGAEITNEMFERLAKKFTEKEDIINSFTKEPSGQLFIVLKRK